MPNKLKDPYRHKFKKKAYNRRDWKSYDAALCHRGHITFWISEDVISTWNGSPKGQRGRPCKYSSLAIETAHTLRLVYHQGFRQTEGFMHSIFELMNLDLPVPDHTTMSRRAETLPLSKPCLPEEGEPIVFVLDSSGLKVFGEKEWMNCKHGTRQRRMWRKLHLGVTPKGEILSSTLTCHHSSDPSQVEKLLKGVNGHIAAVMGDGGYDHAATYQAINEHVFRKEHPGEIQVIIPPNTGFQKAREGDDEQRLHNIRVIEDKGKHFWQKEVNYGQRAKVENTFSRYKTIIGNKLRARNFPNQETETKIAIQILNQMVRLGIPQARPSN